MSNEQSSAGMPRRANTVKDTEGESTLVVSERVADKMLTRLNAHAGATPHDSLSDREFQILRLFGAGKTVREIAEDLSLSVPTVSTYRARVLEKLGMKTTAELVRYAVLNRLAP